jgi:hypothetical protein
MFPNPSDRGREVVDSILNAAPSASTGVFVIRGPGRIVDLTISLVTLTGVASSYLFVYDMFDPTELSSTSTSINIGKPLVAPLRVAAGDIVTISPETKWLPFKAGVCFALSSSATSYVADTTATAAFNFSYHMMLGC